jgi:hypothetical protein
MDFACVPNIRLEPVSTLVDGAHVSSELRITGTNTGPTVLGDFGKALLGADVEAALRPDARSTCRPCSCTRSATTSWSPSASAGGPRIPRADRRHPRLGPPHATSKRRALSRASSAHAIPQSTRISSQSPLLAAGRRRAVTKRRAPGLDEEQASGARSETVPLLHSWRAAAMSGLLLSMQSSSAGRPTARRRTLLAPS